MAWCSCLQVSRFFFQDEVRVDPFEHAADALPAENRIDHLRRGNMTALVEGAFRDTLAIQSFLRVEDSEGASLFSGRGYHQDLERRKRFPREDSRIGPVCEKGPPTRFCLRIKI